MESKRTILVVEDEALLALAERRALESFGYAVLTVPDGEKAVETALGNPDVDLVLMDIDLGRGMDGTEAARRILERRDIPVVFLSSHTEPDIVDRTERITSYGYVVKNSGLTVLNAPIRMAFRLFETRRREAEKEERLLKSERTYADIVRRIPSGFFVYRLVAPGRLALEEANPEAERLTGIRLAEWRGRDFDEIWPRAREAGITDRYLEALRSGTAYEVEDLQYSDDKIAGAFRVRTFALPDQRLAVSFEDITERKAAADALRRGRDLLDASQSVAHVGSWLYEPSPGRLTWSDETYRLFGLEPASWPPTYEGFLEMVHPEDRGTVDAAYSRSLADGSPGYELEHRILRKGTGETRCVLEKCVHERDSEGRVLRSVGMVQDITDRKRLETELRKSEERYRSLFLLSPLPFVVTQDDRTVMVNPSAVRFFGADREEDLIGRDPREWLHPDSHTLSLERRRRILETGGGAEPAELKFILRDGREAYVLANLVRIEYRGAPALLSVFQDITAFKSSGQGGSGPGRTPAKQAPEE